MRILKTITLAVFVVALSMVSSAQAAAGFTKIGNVSVLTYTDAACANQTTCYYQVTALDAQGHESPAALCGTSQLCFGTNQVVAVMPSSGTHSVTLNWTASTTAGVTYNIYRAVGPLPPSSASAVVN